jgi:autoinducer 2-degrading protein
VTVFVKEGHEQDFIEAVEKNHEGSIEEEGCVRFDVLRAEDAPSRFFLYEVYRSKEAFKSHQQTEHYLNWKATVAEWMAQPRQGIKHESLFPADEAF